MGNSGLKKIFFPGDFVETKYNNFYEINVIDLDKNEIPLSHYKNKVSLCVNIASMHKSASQEIENLKTLQETYGENHFEVLAFPCNQFANEPGNFKQIKQCYTDIYKVNFPIFAKVEVNGEYTHPAYKFLKKNSNLFNLNLINAKPISEDFSKFLVDQNGNVISYFDRSADFKKISAEIEKLLKKQQKNVVNFPQKSCLL